MPQQIFQTTLDGPEHQRLAAAAQKENQKHIRKMQKVYLNLGYVCIFNVGPQRHVAHMGGQGIFTVQPCPEGKPYSAALRIPRMVPDGQNVDMQEMIEVPDNGAMLAEAVVGYGIGFNPEANMTRKGIFIANGYVTVEFEGRRDRIRLSEVDAYLERNAGSEIVETRQATPQGIAWARESGIEGSDAEITKQILTGQLPTEQEVLDAQSALNKWCLDMVAEANTYFRAGNHIEIQEPHRWAAVRTNNTALPWVKGSLMMGKCPGCANAIDPEAAICGQCKTVVNRAKVIALQMPGYENLWKDQAASPAPTPVEPSELLAKLESMTKEQLTEFAFEAVGVVLNPDDYKKPALVEIVAKLVKQ